MGFLVKNSVKKGFVPNFRFPELPDPARASCERARSQYTSCSIVVLFLASSASTAADNVGHRKNSRDVATHPYLAEQNYSNIHHGGFLLLVFTLYLACSLPKALELLKQWLTRSHGVRFGRMICSAVMIKDPFPQIPTTQCHDLDPI